MDKKNRLSTDYDDEDMNWLDDDDDYLEEGGILSSLLFGDKKKKKRSKADSSRDDDRRSRRPTDVHENARKRRLYQSRAGLEQLLELMERELASR